MYSAFTEEGAYFIKLEVNDQYHLLCMIQGLKQNAVELLSRITGQTNVNKQNPLRQCNFSHS